ncbi:Long-chain-fatty-acid--CoA ligase [Corynebacterium heidelbergense]|nr:Long-chain-fatty-acid--CoA ligase [Corynebacterium heidelbergense]
MQEIPFSIARILEYGATAHGSATITTYAEASPEGPLPSPESESTTFATIGARCAALAHALHAEFGINPADRVSTLLAEDTEHVESLLAVASMGAVFNPLNRHLADDQIIHVINHTQARVIICHPEYADRLATLLPSCPNVTGALITGSDPSHVRMARSLIRVAGREDIRVLGYEENLNNRASTYPWPRLPETSPAAVCYSTGTTGAPKAVVYSHRSLWLHSLNLRTADSFGIRNGIPFLCCVPICHVLSWGVPLAAFMTGAPLILPGRTIAAEHLAAVIENAMPRQAHGSPGVWTALYVHYTAHPPAKMSLREIYSGGSPVPPTLIDSWEETFGVDMIHAWGMTETSPVATIAHPPAGVGGPARARYRYSQGRFLTGVEYRVVDDSGVVLEHNDRNVGEIQVRGNTVTGSYYHSPAQQDGAPAALFRGEPTEDATDRFTADGWLRTGDVGTITQDGFLTIHDRKADVIRSGGEWIYSAALENYVMESPAVIEAAVIGIPDATWGQRPLAVVQLASGIAPNETTARTLRQEVLATVPRWMAPENWTFVASIPKTSVDKFDKKDLRAQFRRGEFHVIMLSTNADQR